MNNDLISRNALIQHAYSAVVDGVEKDIIDLSDVDNAPTIEPEVKKVPIASVTFDTEKLKELTDEIVERIKNGEIVLQDERPQGDIHDFIAKADEDTLFQLKKEIENALTKIIEREAYEEARREAMKLDEADGTLKGRGYA